MNSVEKNSCSSLECNPYVAIVQPLSYLLYWSTIVAVRHIS